MSDLFDLSGKVAIITGSSRGIGFAIADQLARHGANVVISSRKLGSCQAAADTINEACGRQAAIAIAANISEKAELQALHEETVSRLGAVDILVCNAATNPYFGPSAGISDEAFEKVLKNNIIANHWLIQMAVPGMKERNDGSVIIISSIGGLHGSPDIGAYNISKAADMQMARNLAVEYGPSNIRVNTIAPGLIRTDFSRALWEDDKTLAHFTKGACLGRIGEPDEVAAMAVLLSGPGGAFVTGQTFVVDGGVLVKAG